MAAGLPVARMDRMTTSGDFLARGYLRRLRANWPAVLLPLVAVGHARPDPRANCPG